jgi:hypothetical protein
MGAKSKFFLSPGRLHTPPVENLKKVAALTKKPPNWQVRTALFHFCMQRGLSVSSTLRALAYSMSASRAASQRSALVNSWVDITAPLATPSQLMTIRTWVTISSSLRCYWLDEGRMRTCRESEELEPLSPRLRFDAHKGLRVRLLSSRFGTPSPAIRAL